MLDHWRKRIPNIFPSRKQASEVVIEMVANGEIPMDAGTHDWKKAAWQNERCNSQQEVIVRTGPLDIEILREEHHHYYGRPWILGRYHFEHLKSRGLSRKDNVLEFGCGAGRLATILIGYLNTGRYHGVDAHRKALEALAWYELPLYDLESKRPRLLLNSSFDFSYFGRDFDWVVDCYASFHVKKPEEQHELYRNISQVLRRGGRYITVPEPHFSEAQLLKLGLKLLDRTVQNCSLVEGHKYICTNEWFEFKKL